MCPTLDMTDVPAVSQASLWHPMRQLIADGQGLALLRGLTSADISSFSRVLWESPDVVPADRPAVMARLIALGQAFTHRRLRNGLLQSGYRHLETAIKVAAGQRLNAERGFNPLTLAWAIEAEMSQFVQPERSIRRQSSSLDRGVMTLAA